MSFKRLAKLLASAGIAALLAIVVAAAILIKRREHEQRALQRSVTLVPGSLLHANNFHWTQMKGDKEQWELVAREANYSDKRDALKLKDTKLTMTTEDGKQLTLLADAVDLKLTGHHVNSATFTGGVNLDYGGITLRTDSAIYYPDRDELDASGLVQIAGQGFKVSGLGLEAHPHARLFALKHQVNTELTSGARRALPKQS